MAKPGQMGGVGGEQIDLGTQVAEDRAHTRLQVQCKALGQDAAHDVNKAATKTGHVIKHATKKVGSATKTGVKDVGHGTKAAAKDTGKGVKTGVEKAGDGAKDSGTK